MLSVAPVRSASGAAHYFAKDDYYAGEHASEVSAWGGRGAVDLGLSSEVGRQPFEHLLKGQLPGGEQVGDPETRRAGIDLTFSMPKSASVLAYVAGDTRLLAANMEAVRQTMDWVEKTFAEGRTYETNRKGDPIRTGHLTYAMFQHDTSRKLDPQAHIHVVVANLTKVGGEWRALHNEQLWRNNSIIGSVYHAALRALVEDLGYQTNLTGKHGQFEIDGVPKTVLSAFSQRRQDILAKADELGGGAGPARLREITKRTRDAKINLEDRGALRAEWQERAAGLGFDGQAVVAQAEAEAARSAQEPQGFNLLQQIAEKVAEWAELLREWLRPDDPLVSRGMARLAMSKEEIGAEMAVASAIRILGQREAAFPIHEVSRTALNLGIKGVTIEAVERRISALAERGELIFGRSVRSAAAASHVTTREHIAEERKLLAGIDEGRGKGAVILDPGAAADRLQERSGDLPLGAEQLAAGVLSLSSADRTVVVQGVAGAGKTTLIASIAAVARAEGKEVVGLALANTMVAMLQDGAGIPAQTAASFVHEHLPGATAEKGDAFESSRAALANTILVLDEASLVANQQMNGLVTIANRLGIDRLIMIGDRAQLQPIDAGKAFTLIQSRDPAIARLEVSHRQRTEHMKAVAALSREGRFAMAFAVLGKRVVTAGGEFREAAAKKWLELSADDREGTALYASGRKTRAVLNALVQDGLKAEGVLRGDGIQVDRLESLNLTREELRYAKFYKPGQVLEVMARDKPAGLPHGAFEVLRVSGKGVVTLRDEDGHRHRFRPDKLDPTDKRDKVSLFAREEIQLHEGDRIRWTATDKTRGLLNSAPAEILSIGADGVEVRTVGGGTLVLKHGDRMLERLGLAYAINMHQAQGMTTDRGIGVMHSAERYLSNQRLAHVMATRVRDDLTIFTDDRARLLKSIEANPGDKASALELVGDVSTTTAPKQSTAAGSTPIEGPDAFAAASASMRADRMRADRGGKAAELDVPEINLELGL